MASHRENLNLFLATRPVGPYLCRLCQQEFTPIGTRANLKGLCRSRCGKSPGRAPGGKTKSKAIGEWRKKKYASKYTIKREEQIAFYSSVAWRRLRYEVLKKYERKCMVCGVTSQDKVLHVDHIKPISKYPELKLNISNLQVLCEDCNLGKSNRDNIDWRPVATETK